MPNCSKCGKPVTSALMVCDECMPRWIPVTERLPEEFERVLCCTDGHIHVGYRIASSRAGWKVYIDNGLRQMNVHFWMPLPEPPKKVQK